MVKTVKLKRGEGSIVQLKQRDPNSGSGETRSSGPSSIAPVPVRFERIQKPTIILKHTTC
jgi:hypothetical protein